MSNTQVVSKATSSLTAVPPVVPTMAQHGDNNVQIAQANTVNVSKLIVQVQGQQTIVPLTPGAGSSRDYYQLFVTGDINLENQTLSIPAERALTESMSTSLKERLSPLDPEAIAELKTFPALFMEEKGHYGSASSEQCAAYGVVTSIRILMRCIKIDFLSLYRIPQQHLNEMLDFLDLAGSKDFNELNRTHWAVKNVDLVNELRRSGIVLPVLTPGSAI
ncbi:MAG: hypothetical protein Q3976_06280 [Corynebacterium sp.]|nr:hypothetical protein [Corynebacterium sp.]